MDKGKVTYISKQLGSYLPDRGSKTVDPLGSAF